MDFYFGQDGDLKISSQADIAITDTEWRNDAQQAYIRIMTEPGDWTLYPNLGAQLSELYGKPQTQETANYGISIIQTALGREGRFQGKQVIIKGIPTGPQTIRFDIFVGSPVQSNLILSIEQSLGV